MNTYHVCFRENSDDIFLTGKNYTAPTPQDVLREWENEFPTAEFVYLKIVER